MSMGDQDGFGMSAPVTRPVGAPSVAPAGGPATGPTPVRGVLQPPVVYLPCRLDANGGLAEVMMVELRDGPIALLGYTALDRFVAACGDAHPWVLWQTAELDRLRELKPFDVAYLDVPLPARLRVTSQADVDPGAGPRSDHLADYDMTAPDSSEPVRP